MVQGEAGYPGTPPLQVGEPGWRTTLHGGKSARRVCGSTRWSQRGSRPHCALWKESRGGRGLPRHMKADFFFPPKVVRATAILLLNESTNISFIFNTYPPLFSKLVKRHQFSCFFLFHTDFPSTYAHMYIPGLRETEIKKIRPLTYNETVQREVDSGHTHSSVHLSSVYHLNTRLLWLLFVTGSTFME